MTILVYLVDWTFLQLHVDFQIPGGLSEDSMILAELDLLLPVNLGNLLKGGNEIHLPSHKPDRWLSVGPRSHPANIHENKAPYFSCELTD